MAAVLGFGAALLLMYSIKALDFEGGEDEKAEQGAGQSDGHGHEGPVWLQGAGEEDGAKLRMWLARLQAHTAALTRLAAAQEVDREAVDEEVHGIDYLVDSARRLCRGAEPMDRGTATRLRQRVAELIEDIEQLRKLDVDNVRDIERQLRVAGATLLHVHSAAERATFRRWAPRPLQKKPPEAPAVPTSLVFAVVVDSVVDGMLIGLAGSVASTSGWLMAAATTFEMGFLGYSFACSIVKVARPCTAVAILGLPPAAMMTASALACLGADQLEQQAAFSGAIAFAMVAVLFLVFQELLIEAAEKEGGEAWHIGLWLYAGLLLSIHLDLFL